MCNIIVGGHEGPYRCVTSMWVVMRDLRDLENQCLTSMLMVMSDLRDV